MKADLLIQGGQVVIPDQGIFPMDVAIGNGKILALLEPGHSLDAKRVLNAKDKLVIPGGIDAHTHLTMGPGDEGYETETRSAAIGGVTTTLSYLLDAGDPIEKIEAQIAAGESRACGDFGLHPSVVTDAQIKAIREIAGQFGAPSFKFFMVFRGEEGAYLGIPGNDDGFLLKMLKNVAVLPGVIPCVHAENVELVWMLKPDVQKKGNGGLGDWDSARPDYVEAEATQRALYLAERADSPLYVVHVTCKESLDMVRRAKARRPGMVFAETCPHYLTLTCKNAPFPAGKVNPPLRHETDIEALWEGIEDGTIDVVGSDHVPRRFEFKDKDIWSASAGFPGVATMLPIFLTEGEKRGIPLERLISKVTSAPAGIFGLSPSKGSLLPASDGDVAVLDPQREVSISPTSLGSDADYTPWENWRVKYVACHTVLRGGVVVEDGRYVGTPGVGSYIYRKHSF